MKVLIYLQEFDISAGSGFTLEFRLQFSLYTIEILFSVCVGFGSAPTSSAPPLKL